MRLFGMSVKWACGGTRTWGVGEEDRVSQMFWEGATLTCAQLCVCVCVCVCLCVCVCVCINILIYIIWCMLVCCLEVWDERRFLRAWYYLSHTQTLFVFVHLLTHVYILADTELGMPEEHTSCKKTRTSCLQRVTTPFDEHTACPSAEETGPSSQWNRHRAPHTQAGRAVLPLHRWQVKYH